MLWEPKASVIYSFLFKSICLGKSLIEILSFVEMLLKSNGVGIVTMWGNY